jgi:hypothetical protein
MRLQPERRAGLLARLGVPVLLAAGVAGVLVYGYRRLGSVLTRPEFMVDPTRIALEERPSWWEGALARPFLKNLAECSSGPFSVFDAASARALSERWRQVPGVADVRLERVFPDRYRVSLSLSRPEGWVADRGGKKLLVDRHGRRLHDPDLPEEEVAAFFAALPRLTGGAADAPAIGLPFEEPFVEAAAATAAEYRSEFEGSLGFPLRLLEVDASNLGYRYIADPRRAEVRLLVGAADGGVCRLEWDHPPGSTGRRVPVEVKVEVARKIAAEHPGFEGVASADLRLRNTWSAWVRMRDSESEALAAAR